MIQELPSPFSHKIDGTMRLAFSSDERKQFCENILEIINKMFLDDARLLRRKSQCAIKNELASEMELSEP